MQTLPNIEKSAFRPGQYVGYGRNQVWRIRKDPSSRWWTAYSQQTPDCLIARTLADLSVKLAV